MDNVLAAAIIIFILLFGGLSLSSTFISAQQLMSSAWQTMNTRFETLGQTTITAEAIRILNNGSVIEVTLQNDGGLKLADFSSWDVFTEYYDHSETPEYNTGRLDYKLANPSTSEWTVGGIFSDAANEIEESHEPGVLNIGEQIVLRLNVAPAVGVGQSAQVTVGTATGTNTAIIGTRNTPPVLAVNSELRVAEGGSTLISPQLLAVNDTDNAHADLVYTVTTPPEHGTLTPASFTQAQIDDGDVIYTHTGQGEESAEDTFNFTVTDGIDTIGAFTFAIRVNAPPLLAVNAGLVLPSGENAVITNALLQVTDEDEEELPNDLLYTVIQFPSNGILSRGSTFSQADIDNNLLSYTHNGTDADLFTFVITDGYDVIGTYTFLITLVEAPTEP